jgi:LDH2 family malate/lactate/ureidoglycolate dehydrogenase
VIAAHQAGCPVPDAWVVDADGNPTNDPAASRSGGGLDLLGGPVAGHKGYGLALMVDALGILSGNGSGIWQAAYSPEWSQGQWFAAWRVDLFLDPEAFLAEMQRVADYVHQVPARPGATVVLPGEGRAARRSERAALGIPLAADTVAGLQQLAAETGLAFPKPIGRPV